ncbi:hypothetical protein J7I94_31140 [Streptomyces sp. ISL-12]|uniref:hypothetical protein n=1 Tax=Streptomyces sp. ISL-12 TaxID=2819177 RepID=UPI001BECFA68|nr:hypothetical protein [Streptomyces sp. ISL-12]MBT2414943.1 hypothetical protein [Streptomyces sp. ISL-12]
MGVFARLLRKSKATEEAPAAETPAGTPDTGTEAEKAATAVEPAGAGADGTPEPAAQVAVGAAGSDGVEIPKQQSAGKAVDNEADEGART